MPRRSLAEITALAHRLISQPRASRSGKRRPTVAWGASTLERREMLAADAGIAIGCAVNEGAANEGAANANQPSDIGPRSVSDPRDVSAASSLVILDSELTDSETLASSVGSDADLVLLTPGDDAIAQITQALADHRDLESVHLISHGGSGELRLAGETIDLSELQSRAAEIRQWRSSLATGADVMIYGCDFAADSGGRASVRWLASTLGADVAASNDRTGSDAAGGDWELEYTVGAIAPNSLATLDSRKLSQFDSHLGIEIWAAGQTSDELMELWIDDEIVDTWFVRDTDATNEQFLPYFYNVDGISADRIRIKFANDEYTGDYDRNLRVDYLLVDGERFETEHPSVFSNGTWIEGQGVVPGFQQSEYLTNTGYFQYSSDGGSGGDPSNDSTRIEIDAAGETGDETMQLLIDGNVVAQYTSVPRGGATYTYDFDGNLSADRVRVALVNSIYEPGEGYDQNLVVDQIRINGQTFQSESPQTFSTGTWISGQGIVPGNWQSETLHADGYFQYAGGGNGGGGNPGSFSLSTSELSVIEGNRNVTLEVRRLGGSDGVATVNWNTIGDTAIGGVDYRDDFGQLVFGDGETLKTITVEIFDDNESEGGEQFAVRLDNATGANLLAPRTSLVTIVDNDSGLPTYESFENANGLRLNGNASIVGNELQITDAGNRRAGTAFFESAVPINSSTSFQTSFSFRIGGGWGSNGADGLAFVLQNSAAGPDALGRPGGFLAYDNIQQSVAIEFDTYNNGGDIAGNTLAVVLNGDTRNAIAEAPALFDLNSNDQLHAWIEYNGSSNVLAVYLSNSDVKPGFALLKTQVDLSAVVGSSAYLGFTAGSFDQPNYHRVANWDFSFDVPDADPPLNPTGDITSQDLISGLNQPLAIEWSPDGRNLYIAEKAGVIKVARDGSTNPSVLLDISAQVNNVQDRGLIDFALHPDFQNNGYIYLLYTYDPPEVFNHTGNTNAGPDGRGNRAGRLSRFTVDSSSGYTQVVPGSEVVLLGNNSTWENINAFVDSTNDFNEPQAGFTPGVGYLEDFINSDSRSHTVGSLQFNNAGNLFVSIGDGASFNQTDRRALRVQSLNSLSGKVLQIDPFTGQGVSDNPFYDGDPNSNRSKIYQLGLRNPWRLTYDSQTDQLFIGDTGLSSYEEINVGGPGTNFGWPFYEGAQGINNRTPGYRNLPEANGFYNSGVGKPATIALAHQAGSDVVVLGDVVSGLDLGVQYEGDLFYNDMFRGIVRHANVDEGGRLTGVRTFATDAQFVVDIQQGADNSLYYVNLVQGTVGKWVIG